MKKADALKMIRSLALDWARETGVEHGQNAIPDFYDFVSWCQSNGHRNLFEFRSTEGSMEAAENVFDEALGQSWRN
ncbi:hypothetical protein [uncultured Tateyamaria sp.]|uniref:hypothetical protein n=1 Tax=uncultured Tateyamaria sp. TaxID=455651 RepID=UPI0026216BF7|nr:hypothetical protein [uncultured Tateyamaria sp.]